MKTFILLLFTLSINAQFQVNDKKLEWSDVRESELSDIEMFKLLKLSGNFSELETTDGTIVGKFKDVNIDYRGFGKSSASMYIMSSTINGSFKIEFKKDRHRILVNNLKLVNQIETALSETGELTALEFYGMKKNGEMKSRFKKADVPIFEYTFNGLFKTNTEADW